MRRLKWGIVGGGDGSQIGFAHRSGAELDRLYFLSAGAFDIDPVKARRFAEELGVDSARAYGSWQEMLSTESARTDRLDLVTVATPNSTHFDIAAAFLDAGFNVLCEKPMTTTRETAERLVEIVSASGKIFAVNFGYTGYPLVRQMRSMVLNGEIGKVRLVKAEFAAGFLADAELDKNPRVRWRFDPQQAGASFVMADLGSHAMHLAVFVTGQSIYRLSADFAHGVAGRMLEDDALVAFRMDDGAIGRLWVSGLALGRTHGLTLQVFGESGSLIWRQEHPEQLLWTPLGQPTRILERGNSGLAESAIRANRITEGHPEGMVLAFANIYRDLAEVITAKLEDRPADPLSLSYPNAEEGRHMVDVVWAAAESSSNGSQWLAVDGS